MQDLPPPPTQPTPPPPSADSGNEPEFDQEEPSGFSLEDHQPVFDAVETTSNWQPLELDAAAALLPEEVRKVLKERLLGDFREVRRYVPPVQKQLQAPAKEIIELPADEDPALVD